MSGCYTPFETTLGLWKGIIIRSRISLLGYLATSRTLMKQDTELVSFNEGGTWESGARIVVPAGAWIALRAFATLYDGARLSDLEKTFVASVSKRADPTLLSNRETTSKVFSHIALLHSMHPTHFNRTRKRGLLEPSAPG